MDSNDNTNEEQPLNTMADTDIVSEQDLAQIFGKHPESIKRAIVRGELPEPVQLFKRRVWTAGAIREHLQERLRQAQEQKSKDILRINRNRA